MPLKRPRDIRGHNSVEATQIYIWEDEAGTNGSDSPFELLTENLLRIRTQARDGHAARRLENDRQGRKLPTLQPSTRSPRNHRCGRPASWSNQVHEAGDRSVQDKRHVRLVVSRMVVVLPTVSLIPAVISMRSLMASAVIEPEQAGARPQVVQLDRQFEFAARPSVRAHATTDRFQRRGTQHPAHEGDREKSVSTGPTNLDAMPQMTSVSRPTRRANRLCACGWSNLRVQIRQERFCLIVPIRALVRVKSVSPQKVAVRAQLEALSMADKTNSRPHMPWWILGVPPTVCRANGITADKSYRSAGHSVCA